MFPVHTDTDPEPSILNPGTQGLELGNLRPWEHRNLCHGPVIYHVSLENTGNWQHRADQVVRDANLSRKSTNSSS